MCFQARYLVAKQAVEIHWLSIMNSIVLVFLLIGFLVLILHRVLRNDYARYSSLEHDDVVDELGLCCASDMHFKLIVQEKISTILVGNKSGATCFDLPSIQSYFLQP